LGYPASSFQTVQGEPPQLQTASVDPAGVDLRRESAAPTAYVKEFAPIQILRDVTDPDDTVTIVFGEDDGDGRKGGPKKHERVENAIDNTGKKYLNYNDLGSGFIVEVAGPTLIQGARFYPTNDAAGRDPASYVIEGGTTRRGARTWVPIASGKLALPSGRVNTDTEDLDAAFPHYEVTFASHRIFLVYFYQQMYGTAGDHHSPGALFGWRAPRWRAMGSCVFPILFRSCVRIWWQRIRRED